MSGAVGFSAVPSLGDAQKVVVLGSSARAVDTAIYLVKQGKQVQIVTPDPMDAFEKGHSVNVRQFIQNALTSNGVRIWPSASGITVTEDGVSFTSNEIGVDFTVAADAVVDLSDLLPNPPPTWASRPWSWATPPHPSTSARPSARATWRARAL